MPRPLLCGYWLEAYGLCQSQRGPPEVLSLGLSAMAAALRVSSRGAPGGLGAILAGPLTAPWGQPGSAGWSGTGWEGWCGIGAGVL